MTTKLMFLIFLTGAVFNLVVLTEGYAILRVVSDVRPMYDSEYIDIEFEQVWINETHTAMDGNVTVKKEIGEGACEYNDGRYYDSGINIHSDFCKFLEEDHILYPSLLRNSDLPRKCPLSAKTYSINEYMPDDIHQFDDFFPGKLRLDITISIDMNPVFGAMVYIVNFPDY